MNIKISAPIVLGIIIGLTILLIGESIIYKNELGEAIKTIPDLITSVQLKLTKNQEKRCNLEKGTWVKSKNCCRPYNCPFIDCIDEKTGAMTGCPGCDCMEDYEMPQNYKLFRNSDFEYGYSFLYPKEWQEYPIKDIPQEAKEMKIFAAINPDNKLENKSIENSVVLIVFKNGSTLDELKTKIEKGIGEEKNYKILKTEEITPTVKNGYELVYYLENNNKKFRGKYLLEKDIIFGLSCGGNINFYNTYCNIIISSFSSL